MTNELVMEICLAVCRGANEAAQEGFSSLLESAAEQELLKAVGDCLLAAVRRQQRQLFDDWLAQARSRLLTAVGSAVCAQGAATFLTRLSFVVCDRRLAEARPALAQLVRCFMNSADAELRKAFGSELLNLAARMARRSWREETSFLLRLYLRDLLKASDTSVWQARLLALQLHFVVYARWDGFTKACSAYTDVLYLLLVLVRRAEKKKYKQEQREQYLLLSLRCLRGIITNAARSLMTDEMELFRQLYQFFWQLAGENRRRRQQLQLLLQLAISYWNSSLPKTSRKQLKFLADLLQPSLINADYEALLKAI